MRVRKLFLTRLGVVALVVPCSTVTACTVFDDLPGSDAGARSDGAAREDGPLNRMDAGADRPSMGSDANDGGSCSGPHLYHDPDSATPDHCYRFTLAPLNWTSAESDCVAWQGYLVAISDEEEFEFVSGIVNTELGPDAGAKKAVLIGLERDTADGGDGGFVWVDGTELIFRHWGGGEPEANTKGTLKDCVVQWNSSLMNYWDNYVCIVEDPYICERDHL